MRRPRSPFVALAAIGVGALALVPAAVGIAGNASFSQEVPVRVPASVRTAADQTATVGTTAPTGPRPRLTSRPTPVPARVPTPSGARTSGTGDDRSHDRATGPDHHGASRGHDTSGSDDSGHHGTERADDDSHGGSGSDDSGGGKHGGDGGDD